jgi:hypothetical protein
MPMPSGEGGNHPISYGSHLRATRSLSGTRADRTLELLDDVIQCLQRTRHAQADEIMPDPLDGRLELGCRSHAAAPSAASRLPTAS